MDFLSEFLLKFDNIGSLGRSIYCCFFKVLFYNVCIHLSFMLITVFLLDDKLKIGYILYLCFLMPHLVPVIIWSLLTFMSELLLYAIMLVNRQW